MLRDLLYNCLHNPSFLSFKVPENLKNLCLRGTLRTPHCHLWEENWKYKDGSALWMQPDQLPPLQKTPAKPHFPQLYDCIWHTLSCVHKMYDSFYRIVPGKLPVFKLPSLLLLQVLFKKKLQSPKQTNKCQNCAKLIGKTPWLDLLINLFIKGILFSSRFTLSVILNWPIFSKLWDLYDIPWLKVSQYPLGGLIFGLGSKSDRDWFQDSFWMLWVTGTIIQKVKGIWPGLCLICFQCIPQSFIFVFVKSFAILILLSK